MLVERDIAMDELVDQISTATSLDPAIARKAIGIIVGFLRREGPADKVATMIDKLPGARVLADENGTGSGGLLGVFNDLAGAGLSMTEIQAVASSFLTFAKTKIGEREVDDVVRGIPGLGQFI
jgi:hypothetical protein